MNQDAWGESCVCGSRPCVFSLRKAPTSFSGFDPISVARRLAGHQKAHCASALVHGLMRLPGSDLDSVPFGQDQDMMLNLHGQFAFQYEEELACTLVMMPYLAGARWHLLFDDV